MKRVIQVLVVLVVLAGLGWVVYEITQRMRQREQLSASPAERKPLKVAVVRLAKATLERRTAVTGEIRALQVVDIVPKIVGRLERLRLPDGTPLEEGTPIRADAKTGKLPALVVIEHEALKAAFQQAEAAHKVAQAAIATARAAVASARAAVKATDVTHADCLREKGRMARLFQEGSGTAKQRDAAEAACDSAAAQRERARADLATAQARVAEAEAAEAQGVAAVRKARVPLDDATIHAPLAGVVTRKYVDEGNMVGPTTPLVQISQIQTVKIVGGVSERHLRSLAAGKTRALVAVDAFPNEDFGGTVHLVGQSVDPATRTLGVEIRVPNPGGRLKPGMFARVQLVLERKEHVLVVPDRALLRDEKGTSVYVLVGTTAHRRRVSLGLSEGVLHEVTAGVGEGDRVVVRGQRQLADGQPVVPVEEKEP